jgi:sec-independent protein translocase protein TatC
MAEADALREAGVSGGPPGVAGTEDGSVMSLVDHLGELRTRIFRSLLAVVAGSVLGFASASRIIEFLVLPLPEGGRELQVLDPSGAFLINLRIAVVVGVIVAMPVILFQAWRFVAPGLTAEERRIVRPWIPLALGFFALGVALAYVVLPYAVLFLVSFGSEVLVVRLAAGPYFDFVTTMFLAFGLVMEFPILLFGLSRVGLVTSDRLRAARRFVILGIAIFAAIVTPGGDLVSPFALGLTMYALFEVTVFAIRRSGR